MAKHGRCGEEVVQKHVELEKSETVESGVGCGRGDGGEVLVW